MCRYRRDQLVAATLRSVEGLGRQALGHVITADALSDEVVLGEIAGFEDDARVDVSDGNERQGRVLRLAGRLWWLAGRGEQGQANSYRELAGPTAANHRPLLVLGRKPPTRDLVDDRRGSQASCTRSR